MDIVWGATLGKMGYTWAVANRNDPVLVCVDTNGSVVSTQSLLSTDDAPWDLVALPIPMHVAGDRVLIGVGNQLLSVKNSQVELLERLPSPVKSLFGGSPYAAPIIAASMESGVAVIRLGFEGYVKTRFPELREASVLLNSGGFLIAADQSTIQVQELETLKASESNELRYVEAVHDSGTSIAVLPAAQTKRFTLVADSGVVSIYEIKS